MSSQSNAIPDTPVHSQVIAVEGISESRRLSWSMRRELWESRSIYLAPLGVAGVTLFGFLISMIHVRNKLRVAMTLNPMQQHQVIVQPYDFAALLIMATTFVVAVFYCLDALHGERRDRSILFWKSLPVSDLTTVLSKASIPLVVLPLLTFAVTVVTQLIMLLVSSAVLSGSGLSVATLWAQVSPLQMWLMLLYHLVAVHALWYAPIYAWLLLVSGWARRLAILWAALPLLAIGIVEKIAFNTSHFAALMGNRVGGGPEAVIAPGSTPMDAMTHLTPLHFLVSPGLWIGLAIAAACLAAAVRLRRSREPI